jgi:hypothetical protein
LNLLFSNNAQNDGSSPRGAQGALQMESIKDEGNRVQKREGSIIVYNKEMNREKNMRKMFAMKEHREC